MSQFFSLKKIISLFENNFWQGIRFLIAILLLGVFFSAGLTFYQYAWVPELKNFPGLNSLEKDNQLKEKELSQILEKIEANNTFSTQEPVLYQNNPFK